jgi:hypothetical protein
MKHLKKGFGLILVMFILNTTYAQLNSNSNNYIQEKIYLHTDKNTYLTGEIAWFKVYNTEAISNNPSDISKIAYVEVLDNNNTAVLQAKIGLVNGLGTGSLFFPNNLSSGNYTIRAYTNWMKNDDTDMIFEKSISIYNSKLNSEFIKKVANQAPFKKNSNLNTLQLSVAINKTYTTRKTIEIAINTKDLSGNPTASSLSMSIYKLDEMQSVDSLSIVNYLSQKNSSMSGEIKFLPEYNGHIISGSIINSNTQKPISEAFVYLSIPGTNTQFKTSLSDRNGRFKFDMPNLYNEGQIIVQTEKQYNQLSKITIDNPFFKRSTISTLALKDTVNKELLLDRHINVEVAQYYSKENYTVFNPFHYDTSSFYYKPDRTYLLDNFVRFSTLEEVIREYVTPISITKKKGQFEMNVYDEEQKQFFENSPLVLLNGVPIFDVDNLMRIDPLKIRKLDVLMRTYYYGNAVFSGVINFITYNGKIEEENLIPSLSYFNYDGLQKQRNFYTPTYETDDQKESHLPDFRTTLQWLPNINISEAGNTVIKTTSSDLPGNYIISIQGITKDGKIGSLLVPFQVIDK